MRSEKLRMAVNCRQFSDTPPDAISGLGCAVQITVNVPSLALVFLVFPSLRYYIILRTKPPGSRYS